MSERGIAVGERSVMPPDEWDAYDSEPCDDPDNWQDEADEQ